MIHPVIAIATGLIVAAYTMGQNHAEKRREDGGSGGSSDPARQPRTPDASDHGGKSSVAETETETESETDTTKENEK